VRQTWRAAPDRDSFPVLAAASRQRRACYQRRLPLARHPGV